MEESPEEYAERVLAYCMKATKPIDVHDPALNRIDKAAVTEPKPDVFDALLKAYDQPLIKAPAVKPTTQNGKIDYLLKSYGVTV